MPSVVHTSQGKAPNLTPPLQAVVNAIADPALLILADGTLITANRSFRENLDLTEPEYETINVFTTTGKTTIPLISGKLEQNAKTSLQDGCDRSFDDVWHDQPARITVIPFPATNENDAHLIVTIRHDEVDRHRQTEPDISESRRRLELAMESARAGVWEWDLNSGENIWSDEHWSLLGLDKDDAEASFDLWANSIHPDDRERTKAAVIESATNEQEISIEYRVIRPDGQVIWVFSRGKPLLDDHGRPIRYIGTIIDVNDRKLAEEELKKHKARQDFILEKSHIGWWSLDLKTLTTVRTSEYDRLFGHETPLPEWTLQTLFDHIVPEDRQDMESRFRDSLWTRSNSDHEFRIIRPDGQVRWIWSTAAFELDSNGQRCHLSGIVRDITELKEMLESLRRSEAKYRSLFENMPKGIAHCRVIYDGDTPVDFIHLAVNPAYEKMTGFREVVGKGILELLPGIREFDEEFFQIHCRVARTGVTEHFERYLQPLDQWVSTSVYSIEKDHYVAIIDFITEQKKATQLISDGKAKLEAVLDSMSDAVFFTDAAGNLIDFNEAFATFHRFGSKQTCAKSIDFYSELLEVYSADGRLVPFDQWIVSRALYGETGTDAEYILRHKDTGETWFGNYSYAPLLDGDGRVTGSVVTARDVTEKKRAEFRVRENEFKFRSIFDSAPIAISIESVRNRQVIDVNTSWEELFGYRKNEALGRSTTELGILHDVREEESFRQALETEGRVVNITREFRMKSGNKIHALCSAVFLTVDGTPCMLVMTSDITAQKRSAEEHEQLQAQLQQAQKMELVGQLAGGIAHDFNNVLAAILGNTELLLDQVDASHPFTAQLESIRSSANRSAQMIHQLLAFARKQLISPVVLALDDSIAKVLPMLRIMAGENIRIQWKPGGNRAQVRIDPSQLDQLVSNLLVNARDAMSGSGTIILETRLLTVRQSESEEGHPCRSAGDYVTLSITDTGSGIAPQTLPHIFEPYFTTKDVGQGSGLGLSTVFGIVRQNNGYVGCSSEPGNGATFTIYLPLFSSGACNPGQNLPESVSGTSGRTVLLVEDEPEILKLIRMILGKNGFRVLDASSADVALDLAEQHLDRIDLLVTDVVLPRMDGVQLSRILQEKKPELRVLFMSGYALDAIGFQELRANDVSFIQKPFTFKNFTNAVNLALC